MVVSGPLWLFIIWETVDKFSRSGRVEHPGRAERPAASLCVDPSTSDREPPTCLCPCCRLHGGCSCIPTLYFVFWTDRQRKGQKIGQQSLQTKNRQGVHNTEDLVKLWLQGWMNGIRCSWTLNAVITLNKDIEVSIFIICLYHHVLISAAKPSCVWLMMELFIIDLQYSFLYCTAAHEPHSHGFVILLVQVPTSEPSSPVPLTVSLHCRVCAAEEVFGAGGGFVMKCLHSQLL